MHSVYSNMFCLKYMKKIQSYKDTSLKKGIILALSFQIITGILF